MISVCFLGKAGDSLKTKLPKVLIETNFSSKYFTLIKDIYFGYSSPNYPEYSILLEQDIAFGATAVYNLFSSDDKGTLRFFGIGTGFNLTSYDLTLNIIEEPNYKSNATYTFDPSTVKKKMISYNIPLFLNYTYQDEHNLYFSAKMGVYFSLPDEKKLNLKYERYVSSFYVLTDPVYITPSNPNGYYSIYSNYTDHKEIKIKTDNSVNPFFNLSVGYRIKRFNPYFCSEIMRNNIQVIGEGWSFQERYVWRNQLGLMFSF